MNCSKIKQYELFYTCKTNSTLFSEQYLRNANGHLLSDLLSSYLCLLEDDNTDARLGALKALAIFDVSFGFLF